MSTFLHRLLRRTPNSTGRLPMPRFVPRFAALVLSATVLVLLAASVADHPAQLPSWLDPFGAAGWVLTRIRYVTAGIGEVFAGDAAATGARIEFFLVAFAVVVSLRWLRFWWLTVRPGPIEVVLLEDATVDPGTAEQATEQASAANTALRTYVTMMLREKLSSVTVYLPTPAPGDAVGGGFLQTMRESARETWWGTTIEFITRIIPRSAYRVDGAVLRRADHEDSYGVAVRITVFPRQRTVASTVWARTPERAADCAARVVAAAILPLTRRCLASPWRHWHGQTLPVELLADYEEASAFREQRRYDEALGRYRAALERDSLNPLIRLEMAQIQEQLGLYLDALATYDNALTLWSGSPERYNSWLHRTHRFTAWQRLFRWRRYGNPFVARYRYATALAYFEKLTPQWVKPEGRDPRSRERSRLRHLLVTKLAERYGQLWKGAAELKTTLNELTEQARSSDPAKAREAKAELSRLFLEMSRYELRQLVRDHRSWLGWADSSDLTTRSLTLARDSWIDIRLHVAKRGLADADGTEVHDPAVAASLAALHRDVDRTTRRSKGWMDHYNAACTYGQVLVLIGRVPEHREFAQAAVRHLFTGLESVDSSQVSRQRSWILSEDADLRELRRCGEFQPFAAAIGPAGGAVVLRPRRTQIAELGEYEVNLLIECTRTMEARWRDGPVPADDDAHAWWRVHQLAMAHRHWPDRLDAITYFRGRPAGAPPWEVVLPDFATFSPPGPVNDDADRLDTWSDQLIKRGNLSAIFAALWIRSRFLADPAGAMLVHPAGVGDRAECWRELREIVTHAHLEPAVPITTDVRDRALAVIERANQELGCERPNPHDPGLDWGDQAWLWAEEQRVDHPNDGTVPPDIAAHSLARAFAALAIAYDGIGDGEPVLRQVRRLNLSTVDSRWYHAWPRNRAR